ncbi:cytochrome c-type biogenesis protein [Clostridium amylolyticum]|uniref:Cytochrome c-type biogenesis protein n=1 Tax=Clostridium amylolyticum TaxID=1121298 RepID=A0A1M6NSQ9_9CLOT|nr:cytochrome c biogenesis CcdA family protein [Clostridium amylolyticum]SHJ98761.1 cytochrome c-type biogenesis protein [Clostridium amylolyticum]
MNNVSLFLAFSAGLISFLSPCVLPLVPAYVSYMTGESVQSNNKTTDKFYILYKSLGFVIGFSIVFVIMGASITSLGKLFIKNQMIFKRIAGILIIIFGLHTSGILKIKFFSKEKKFMNLGNSKGAFGSVLMGMAFAAGWTPCVGPILSSILVYATSMDTIGRGILLLILYSLGLAVPFVLTALAVDKLSSKLPKVTKHLKVVSIISGILLIILGVLIFTNKVGLLSNYFNFINI